MPIRPKSAPQSKLASEMGKDGPYAESDVDSIAEHHSEQPSTSKSMGRPGSKQAAIGKVCESNYWEFDFCSIQYHIRIIENYKNEILDINEYEVDQKYFS